jgi:transposase-like protein
MRWRRIWLDEEKGRIVAEIGSSGDSVCAVARRNGLSPQHLFGWRRRLRDAEATSAEAGGLEFVPAVVDADRPAVASSRHVVTWLNRSAVSLFAVLLITLAVCWTPHAGR